MTNPRTSAVAARSPAGRYLSLIQGRLQAIRRELPALTALGEKMAAPMLKGGRFFIPKVAPFWPREFGGRAGGFMGITHLHHGGPSRSTDVAYVSLPCPERWKPAEDKTLTGLLKSRARVFVNGRLEELEPLGRALLKRVAGFTGGASADEGLYALGDRRPLAGLRHFDQFVRGWATTGEFVGACTRGGKMPIVYMSVWLEGALARNATFIEHHNLSEPWFAPFFHRDVYVPPLAPGYAGGAFLDIADGHLKTLQAQLPLLAQAGQWMAEAKADRRRIWTVAVGHSYPDILELPQDGSYPIEWGPSFSDLRKALPRDLKAGDVVLHMGYAPVNVKTIEAILKRGIRLIHTSPYGRPATLRDHKNLLWFDLPWRPADASVDVPGYSVRILPMSSTCHTMAYFAIVSELAERMGWK